MKKKSVKLTALICCAAVVMSLASCAGGAPRHTGRETDNGNKIENGYSDPTYSTDPTTDPTADPTAATTATDSKSRNYFSTVIWQAGVSVFFGGL